MRVDLIEIIKVRDSGRRMLKWCKNKIVNLEFFYWDFGKDFKRKVNILVGCFFEDWKNRWFVLSRLIIL